MLTYIESVPELVSHVIVPVTQQLTHSIIDEIGCQNVFKNKIMHTGDFISNSKTSTDDQEAILDDDLCTCEINPNLNPYSQKEDTTEPKDILTLNPVPMYIENKMPLFFDLDTKTFMICHQTGMSISLNYKLSFKDRVVAYQAYDRMIATVAFGGWASTLDFVYTYPIPENMYTLLYMVHTMKGGEPKKFMEYLRDKSNGVISMDINRSRNESIQLVARENASRVYINIEMGSERPTANKDNASAKTYDIEFTATIQMQKPDNMYLKYPIVVNNQFIPDYAIPVNESDSYTTSVAYHKYFTRDGVDMYLNPPNPDRVELIKYPWYDQWKVPHVIEELGYTPFFMAIVTLDDTENPQGVTTIDLAGDLDGRTLKPEVIEELVKLDTLALFPMEGFMISLFANDTMQTQESLTLTNGTTLTIPNRDISKVYHVVLSEKKGIIHGNLQVARVGIFDIVTEKERLH